MHLDDTSLLVGILAGYGVVFSRRRIHEAICMRYHAIAACPTDGYQMRSDAGRQRGRIRGMERVVSIHQRLDRFALVFREKKSKLGRVVQNDMPAPHPHRSCTMGPPRLGRSHDFRPIPL